MHFCYKVCESWLGRRQHRTKPYFTRRKHRERTACSGSVKRKGKYCNVTPITWKQIPSNEHPWKLHNNLDPYHSNTWALLNSISSALLFIFIPLSPYTFVLFSVSRLHLTHFPLHWTSAQEQVPSLPHIGSTYSLIRSYSVHSDSDSSWYYTCGYITTLRMCFSNARYKGQQKYRFLSFVYHEI